MERSQHPLLVADGYSHLASLRSRILLDLKLIHQPFRTSLTVIDPVAILPGGQARKPATDI